MLQNFLMVGLGGGLGAMSRYGSGLALTRMLGASFPYGTLFVNVLGSLLMGLFMGFIVERSIASELPRLLLATGFLGGFTTFSAFSLDAVTLFERGEIGLSATYIVASLVVSILALMIGLMIARGIFA